MLELPEQKKNYFCHIRESDCILDSAQQMLFHDFYLNYQNPSYNNRLNQVNLKIATWTTLSIYENIARGDVRRGAPWPGFPCGWTWGCRAAGPRKLYVAKYYI